MKNLTKTLILGTVIGLTGCSPSIYDFNGIIDGEKVYCLSYSSLSRKIEVDVTKKDGRKIDYISLGKERKLKSVTVNQGENYSKVYTNDEVGAEALQIAQKQFDSYLAKILEIKKKQALEDIKQ